ncbi:hypothetical protein Ddye_013088 [Dipteronia dyeriana]|uniref:RNase H type-1 domain-containing protein n=1 Tax=Dipteronia dyeriana TaxID=168575 RepID=A0AAE0CJ99_9ROSI|nr:hypothetical protein Ddye_013088 [Dipteronia dyeriana]
MEVSSSSQVNDTSWKPPLVGLVKINTDETIDAGSGKVGICIIIRNGDGKVIASGAQVVLARFSPLVAESVALLKGLQLGLSVGVLPCVIESDALGVVNLVTVGHPSRSDVGLVIQDVLQILKQFPDCFVVFTPMKTNMAAHDLAKLGLTIDSDLVLLEDFPPCVASIVSGDRPN